MIFLIKCLYKWFSSFVAATPFVNKRNFAGGFNKSWYSTFGIKFNCNYIEYIGKLKMILLRCWLFSNDVHFFRVLVFFSESTSGHVVCGLWCFPPIRYCMFLWPRWRWQDMRWRLEGGTTPQCMFCCIRLHQHALHGSCTVTRLYKSFVPLSSPSLLRLCSASVLREIGECVEQGVNTFVLFPSAPLPHSTVILGEVPWPHVRAVHIVGQIFLESRLLCLGLPLCWICI